MWRNYLTVGFRSLVRSRTYAFINIFGLAIGLAASLLLILYVRYETSYDAWLPDSERIYQVQATWHEPGQPVSATQSSPMPVHDTLVGGFPQIEAITIAVPSRPAVLHQGRPITVEGLRVDPAFFDIFQLRFLRGSAGQALPNVTSIVLTETEAIRQFGSIDVIGQTITTSGGAERRDYIVTGVVADMPNNSHMAFDALLRFDPALYAGRPEIFRSWGAMGQYHYVKLRPEAEAEAINAALPDWEKRVIPPQVIDGRTASQADIMDLELVPVRGVHLGEAQQLSMTPGNDHRTVATFAIVAALILAMACINFINLSTARAGQRAREVALRKVLGASRKQLVLQFLGESVLLATLSMLIALTLIELFAPMLGNYLDADFQLRYFGGGGIGLMAVVLIALVGALGGLYPAFFLARFQPAHVLRANKSSAEPHGTGRLRNLLVVAQFAISIGLIICTWVVYSQTRFVTTVDPGYERDGLIQVGGAWRLQETGSYEAAKRRLESVPGIVAVGRTNLGIAAINKSIQAVSAPGGIQGLNVGVYRADPDFFSAMGMRLLAGRMLGERFANDRLIRSPEGTPIGNLSARGLNIIVNRRAAQMFGFRDPSAALGQQVRTSVDGAEMVPCTIVGVVEDTRVRSARDEIEPLIFTFDPDEITQLIVRYRSDRPGEVMEGLRNAWLEFLPDIPFDAAFAEDLVAELYQRDRTRAAVFGGFAILAVIISCLGLFGLAAFTAARRTKEIGIRKVLGARVADIVKLLVWQFTKPVVIANLIAWPVAWWVMRDWLNTFDVRIDLGLTPFALAGLLALGIAIGTIAGHAIRVARTNPIHALRYE
ncbi:ABC transporter permease [Sphingosinicella sp. CPCC 101087]|uniref:ABC transporter permease n=1 Tax=Sphingosinicella sp. CPCC 101087 TaxID=2497754 RepID=UPI00101D3613|nr:ABC transporter permease [Sphingosinicella sp. CPCC 101087]